jgi:membrane associated rhomboid family serine protease
VFPIKDDNPTLRTPIVTLVLIIANGVCWFLFQGAGAGELLAASVCELGVIPGEITGQAIVRAVPMGETMVCELQSAAAWHTLLTSMFMHGSWMHILGNMWFLWIFGNNVEDSMGRGRFVVFYALCGLAAALAQIAADPQSPVPMVGASGAIGGVMGAYVVLYPTVPVRMLVVLGFYITTVAVPAYLMLGYWFVLQIFGGMGGSGAGVAFWAHIGGFVAGVLLIFGFRDSELVERHRRYSRGLGLGYGRRKSWR